MKLTATLPIEQLRKKLTDNINQIRTAKLLEPVEFDGHYYDADPISLQNLTAIVASISAGIQIDTVTWRDYNNIDVELNTNEIIGLAGTMLARNQTLYSKSFDLKNQIMTSENPETIRWVD